MHIKGNSSGDLLDIFSTRLPDHQDLLKMSAKVPFSKIARIIAYFILFLTFVTFIYYQTRAIIMESSALGFGRSYEGKELLGSVLYVTCFVNRLLKLYWNANTLLILSCYCEIFKVVQRSYLWCYGKVFEFHFSVGKIYPISMIFGVLYKWRMVEFSFNWYNLLDYLTHYFHNWKIVPIALTFVYS